MFSDNKNTNLDFALKINHNLKINKTIACINQFADFKRTDDSLFACNLQENLHKFNAIKINTNVINSFVSDSLSGYLEKQYNYKGLFFADWNKAMDDDKLARLICSGINMFIVKAHVRDFISQVNLLVSKGEISEKVLDKRIRKILLAKTWMGLNKASFLSAEKRLQKIFSTQNKKFSWQIYENTATLVKNNKEVLPFNHLSKIRAAFYSTNKNELLVLKKTLHYYFNFTDFSGRKKTFLSNKKYFSHLIIAFTKADSSLLADSLFIKELKKKQKRSRIIVLNYAAPVFCKKINFVDAIIQLYDCHPFSQSIAAQIISGAIAPKGKFPISRFCKDTLTSYKVKNRLEYTIPEMAGFNAYDLRKIDTIIKQSEFLGVSPGYQILAAKDGKVFFYKSYGYHTYARKVKVQNSDLFDLASITKVAAITLASMKLYEWDSIHLNDSLKYYLCDTNCRLKNHQLRDFFVHKSGLPADMPILKYIIHKDSLSDSVFVYYSTKKDSIYSIEIAENFYLRNDLRDSIINSLYNLEYDTNKTYTYSDINFNIIFNIVQQKLNEPVNEFLNHYFYSSLGLQSMGFNPLKRFDKKHILPTAVDKYWRKQLVWAYPHDESAALYGGIAGNAGLFSNANDLAILFQMLLNGGTYGGKRYFLPETVALFTSPQEDSPRGLGFNRKRGGYFGHSGFTGCVVWANPVSGILYVFLSNSIHPSVKNKKLKRYKIRKKVLDALIAAQIHSENVVVPNNK